MTNLKHFGIPGMKWGIRRKNPSGDYTKAREIRKKHVSEMSNDELKTVIGRLSLEKQYKDISAATVGRGNRFVSQLIQRVGAQLINNYARTQVNPQFVEIFSELRKKSQNRG